MALNKSDLAGINELAENITSRLTGGLHGEFHVGGSKSEENNRHEQLPIMFKLKELLEYFQPEMQKQQRAKEENEKTSKATGKVNLIKTFKSMIEQEMADRLRDLEIKCDRNSELRKKDQDLIAKLAAKVQALEQEVKNWKQQPKAEKIADGKLLALQTQMEHIEYEQVKEERVQALEGQVTSQRQTMEARLHALENRVTFVGISSSAEVRMQDLESRLTPALQLLQALLELCHLTGNSVAALETKLASLSTMVNDNADRSDKHGQNISEEVDKLFKWAKEDLGKIQALQARQSNRPRGVGQETMRWIENNFQRRVNHGYY